MSQIDALASWKDVKSSGLYLKLKSDEPVVIRVMTLDPIVSKDKWGNTKYSFVVYNWTEGRAQILQKPKSVLSEFTKIHTDDDYPSINKVDIKLSSTGEMLETRYSVMPLPKARELTNDLVRECQKIDLAEIIPEGIRLSAVENGEAVPQAPFEADNAEGDQEPSEPATGYDKAKQQAEKIRTGNTNPPADELGNVDIDEEPLDLDSIQF